MNLLLLAHLALSLCSTEQWRLMDDAGQIHHHFGPLPLSEVARPRGGWAWTCFSPPRRMGSQLPEARVADESIPTLLVTTQPTDDVAVEVLAAPSQMWREVPEHLLPRWKLRSGSYVEVPHELGVPWRIRAVGHGVGSAVGSWWQELAPGIGVVDLTLHPSRDLRFQLVDEESARIEAGTARLWRAATPGRPAELLAASWQQETLAFRAVPDSEELDAVLIATEFEPGFASGLPSSLPSVIELRRGSRLAGRFANQQAEGLEGVRVIVETTVRNSFEQPSFYQVLSKPGGGFDLRGLPPGRAVLTATLEGYASVHELLTLDTSSRDLGTLVLPADNPIELFVHDDALAPVANPQLQLLGPAKSHCNDDGLCQVRGLGKPTSFTLTADGFLPTEGVLDPSQASASQELQRAFTVIGRFVDLDGEPIGDGQMRLTSGNRCSFPPLLDGARLRLVLESGVEYQLALSSPRSREARLSISPGEAGETLDLGDIQPPEGRRALGRLLAAEDGRAVVGARIWLPRASESGPLLAWARKDLLTTHSADDGSFELGGLSPGRHELTIEAASFARWRGEITVGDSTDEATNSTNLGEIRLDRGGQVRVRYTGSKKAGTRVQLDPQMRWLESDFMTATLHQNEATFQRVPAGEARVWVADARGDVLCEELFRLEPGEVLDVDCQDSDLVVAGRVMVGGAGIPSAGSGSLLWQSPPAEGVMEGIFNTTSASGLTRHRTYSTGRPQVDVTIAPDGTFRSANLAPGPWRVTWNPAGGMSASSLDVHIPDVSDVTLDLEFPGHLVIGTVLSEDGELAPGARIRELNSGAVVFTDKAGGFRFQGLAAGQSYSFRAEHGPRRSRVETVEVVSDQPTPPIELVLGSSEQQTVKLAVRDTLDRPAAGGFVFLDSGTGNHTLRGLDAQGTVAVELSSPLPQRLRAAAFTGCWALLPWTPIADLEDVGVLRCTDGGDLTLVVNTLAGLPQLISPTGWDLAYLLARLGQAPLLNPASSVRFEGLPPGIYQVVLDGQRHEVSISIGHSTTLELE